jgi:hypothetical protein
MNEVKHPVLCGFEASDEGRPRYRALRGRSCPKAAEVALISKFREVREIAPVSLDEAWIHSIYAEDDQFRNLPPMRTAAYPEKSSDEYNYGAQPSVHEPPR